ncbi:hypothetical protein Sste5346_004684 [Sporothrix stenoceras]|uniref:Uncharacterized protein n=1 Tax=Sporothrix stenoceras TaxID=5173 RepID=A0ABR3Z6N4_9PEZI
MSVQAGDNSVDGWVFQQDTLSGFGPDSFCFSLGLEDMGYIIRFHPDQTGITDHPSNSDNTVPLDVFIPLQDAVKDTKAVTTAKASVFAPEDDTSEPSEANAGPEALSSVSINTNVPPVTANTPSSSPSSSSSATSTPTSAVSSTSTSSTSITSTVTTSASTSSCSSSKIPFVWTDPAKCFDIKNNIFRRAFGPDSTFEDAYYPERRRGREPKPLEEGPWREYVEKGIEHPGRPDSALWIDEARSTPAPAALMANDLSLASQMGTVHVNGAPISAPTLQTWFSQNALPMGYVVKDRSPTTSISSGATEFTPDAVLAQQHIPPNATLGINLDITVPIPVEFDSEDMSMYGPLLDQAALASCLPTVTGEMALFGIPPNNVPFAGVSDANVFSRAAWNVQPQPSTELFSVGNNSFLEQPGFVNAPAQWTFDGSAIDFSWLPEARESTTPFPVFDAVEATPAQTRTPEASQPQPRRAPEVTEQPKPSSIAPVTRLNRTGRPLSRRVSQSAAVSRPTSVVRRPSGPPLPLQQPFPVLQNPAVGNVVASSSPASAQTHTSISPKTTWQSLKVITSHKHARTADEADDEEESPTKRQQQEFPLKAQLQSSPKPSQNIKGKEKAATQAPISYDRVASGRYDSRFPRLPTGPGQVAPTLSEPCVMVTSSGDFIIPSFSVYAAESIAESDAAKVPQFAMATNDTANDDIDDRVPVTPGSQMARVAAAQKNAVAIAKVRTQAKVQAKAEAQVRVQKITPLDGIEMAPEGQRSKSLPSSSQARVPQSHPYAKNGIPLSMRCRTIQPMSTEELNFGPFASLPVSVPQSQSKRPMSSAAPSSTIRPYSPLVRKSRRRALTLSTRSAAAHKISKGMQAASVTTN